MVQKEKLALFIFSFGLLVLREAVGREGHKRSVNTESDGRGCPALAVSTARWPHSTNKVVSRKGSVSHMLWPDDVAFARIPRNEEN